MQMLRVGVGLCLLYGIWGSTYLAVAVAVQGFDPLLLASVRFALAGAVLLGLGVCWGEGRLLSARKAAWTAVAGVMVVTGNALVCVVEQWVASGWVAVAMASIARWRVRWWCVPCTPGCPRPCLPRGWAPTRL
jgi:drug/metabolite transporter (DMT)-like permease